LATVRDPFTAAKHMRQASETGDAALAALAPTVTHGVGKTRFVQNVSEAEMEWLLAVLRAVVRKRGGLKP
jgi:hypothetical protein